MKKKTLNAIKAAGLVLSLSLAVAGTGVTSYAADDTKYSEKLGAGAKITKDSTGATATTTFSRPGTIKATAIAYYAANGKEYYSVDSRSNNMGGASVTVTKKIDGANVTGGKGEHYVKYGDLSWTPTTTIGIEYKGATKL